ncbi:TPA: hypothetical protein ENS27_00400 [bacterium]|nr:hypothetical protein [bacterium]
MSAINKIKTLFFYFKPRKIVAQYKLFFGDEWLEVSVDSIAPYMYKILLVVSDIPWGKNNNIIGDNLEPVIKKIKNKYGKKILIINGSWDKQIDHVKEGLEYIKKNIPEASHCLYVDSDEIYKKETIEKIVKICRSFKSFNSAIKINYNTYFKTIYYKISPIKYPTALVLFPIRKWITYRDARNVNAKIEYHYNLFYEHPAYVRISDEKMKMKIEAHRETEPIIGDWFNTVWMKWSPDTRNFHPTIPDMWESVVPVDESELPQHMVSVYLQWNKNNI